MEQAKIASVYMYGTMMLVQILQGVVSIVHSLLCRMQAADGSFPGLAVKVVTSV